MEKRILHVVSTLGYGGVSKVVLNYYENIDKTKVVFDFITHGEKEDFHQELIKNGSKIYYIQTIGKSNLINYITTGLDIIKKNGPYYAIHVHTDFQSGVYALIAKVAGIKIRICHSHRTDIPARIPRPLIMLFKKLIKLTATELVACSIDAGKFLFDKEKFLVINNAINLTQFKPLETHKKLRIKKELGINLSKNELIIGHVGSFNEVKNQVFFISLAKELEIRKIKFKIVLVGDGPTKKEIERKVSSHGYDKNFILTGVRSDISNVMQIFDVFLFPSKHEGLGLVVIEAQAIGIPCLVSDSVPTEADMGLSLVKHISLDVPIKNWVNTLISINKRKLSEQQISHSISTSGYNIKQEIDKLLRVYKLI